MVRFLYFIVLKLFCNNIIIFYLYQEMKNTTKECSDNLFKSISLNNGDYCLVSYFKDFQNIHLCKAVRSKEDLNLYKVHNSDIILKTLTSNG